MATINLKLPEERHKAFLNSVRKNGETMQSVLSAFVISYIKNPNQFTIKMEVLANGVLKQNDKSG